jgi:hypothetical protein
MESFVVLEALFGEKRVGLARGDPFEQNLHVRTLGLRLLLIGRSAN